MAVQSITIPPDAARDAKARELVKTAHLWPVQTLRKPWGSFKVGDSFLVTPKGYRVNAVVCECYDYAEAGNVCKHIRAVVQLDAQKVTKPTSTLEDVWPACRAKDCTDEPEPGEPYCWRHTLVDAF